MDGRTHRHSMIELIITNPRTDGHTHARMRRTDGHTMIEEIDKLRTHVRTDYDRIREGIGTIYAVIITVIITVILMIISTVILTVIITSPRTDAHTHARTDTL